ncbi:phage tail protein [uncultured Lacinutrix sp.]|uniref:phage tail protein n=1 Tax=uncultured Lacinutrix sp. TaxID=574032 RepID=UPI00261C1D18|nr:tail fiber protein [uncultured Lacinutrix sp.]
MDPFIGQVMMFGGNFAPRGWAFCNGQLLAISSHSALFSILGTMYGGDGRTTFGLPDLRGRVAKGMGNGPGLSTVTEGEKGGRETVTLTINELPNHNHDGTSLRGTSTMPCNEEDGGTNDAAGNVLGNAASGTPYNSDPADSALGATGAVSITGNTGNTGGQRAFNIDNPYLGVNYVIALEGIFPSRS